MLNKIIIRPRMLAQLERAREQAGLESIEQVVRHSIILAIPWYS